MLFVVNCKLIFVPARTTISALVTLLRARAIKVSYFTRTTNNKAKALSDANRSRAVHHKSRKTNSEIRRNLTALFNIL